MASTELERLARIFSAVLSPLFAGAACGIDEDQFTVDVCSDAGFVMLETVEPATAVDYLALREITVWSESDVMVDIRESIGQPCAGASDPGACQAALAALPAMSSLAGNGSFDLPSNYGLVFTRGDEVGAVTEIGGLKTFLGSIESPGDAALLGVLSGHELRCGVEGQVGTHPEGYVLYTESGTGCGEGDDINFHVVLVRTDGTISVLESERYKRGDPGCAIGRLPPGLRRPRVVAAAGPVGRFFAEVALLEAASVPAFEQLARELVLHGAPGQLVGAAIRARDDERRHARATARLARRFGARPVAPRVRPTPPRPLVEVLSDNAAEGCVRETYGALVAHVQARRAADPEVRRALARIAVDETRHAALSWSLARWARARMTVAERRQVARASASAVERLADELTEGHHAQVHALAGMPEPAEARALFGRLRDALRAEAGW